MAARQQQKGPSLGVQYEDLVPKSEWKDQPEATILTIDVPGFAKEQIRVTYVHTSKMIRVAGERPLADRRWSRFNEVFNVPQYCLVDKIHGSFKDNVLTITMPKEMITKMTNLPEAFKTVADPLEKEKKLEENRLFEEAKRKEKEEEAEKEEKKKLLEERDEVIRKLQEEAKEKSEMMRKLQEEVKAKEKPQERKLVEEATVEKIQERKSPDELGFKKKILKPEDRKLPEVIYTKSRPGSGLKSGSEGVGEVVKSAEAKLGYLGKKEKKPEKSIMQKIREKEITRGEKKKMMMNVGVAAFVIFALGAFVSYNFRSSSPSSSSSSPSSSSSTKPE